MDLVGLIEETLRQEEFEGLSLMLRRMVEYLDAEGAILWEVAPASKVVEEKAEGGYLFTVAHWFYEEQMYAIHNLPVKRSATGRAVSLGKPVIVEDVRNDPWVNLDTTFLERFKVEAFFSFPLQFHDGSQGAINFYFDEPLDRFYEPILEDARGIADLVPGLYQVIQDKVSFNLIRDVNDLFYEAGVVGKDRRISEKELSTVIKKVCMQVSKAFEAAETTIILEDEYNERDGFEIRGTTWPRQIKQSDKDIYKGKKEEGISGWCLEFRKPVRIFDLGHFDRDRPQIEKEYPGLTWDDPLDIVGQGKRIFGVTSEEALPPLSYMCAPIMMGDKTAGAIRCSIATKAPYYFAERELELLKLVAGRIGQAWRSWINRRTVEWENERWQDVVRHVQQLNTLVRDQLLEGSIIEEQLCKEVFETASVVLPDASIMDVRLYDEVHDCLVFKYFRGWEYRVDGSKRPDDEIKMLKRRTSCASGKPDSIASYAYQIGEIQVVHDVSNREQAPHYNEIFPEVRQLVSTPIQAGHNSFGVLTVRTTKEGRLPKHVATIFALIGQQLGLYFQLNQLLKEQTITYDNLAHQLKSPANQAFKQIDGYLKRLKRGKKHLPDDLKMVRSLCAQFIGFTLNVNLFAALGQGKTITCNAEEHTKEDIIDLLEEWAEENRILIPEKQDKKLLVRKSSFGVVDRLWQDNRRTRIDRELFVHAINNLLDNAIKYCFNGTLITISGGLMQEGHMFYTAVRNYGIPIQEDEVEKCKRRGWRSEAAWNVVAEGRGIGLWLVDRIMKAHDGTLEIIPTRSNDLTEIRLCFPIQTLEVSS